MASQPVHNTDPQGLQQFLGNGYIELQVANFMDSIISFGFGGRGRNNPNQSPYGYRHNFESGTVGGLVGGGLDAIYLGSLPNETNPTPESQLGYSVGATTISLLGAIEGGSALGLGRLGPQTIRLPYGATGNNVAVRQHYLRQLEGIPSQIDSSLPIREQAIQAFQLRNAAKAEARAMMTDREAAALLDKTDPIPTLQDIVRKVYDGGRGKVCEEMWQEILESSTRSRSSVNEALGVGN